MVRRVHLAGYRTCYVRARPCRAPRVAAFSAALNPELGGRGRRVETAREDGLGGPQKRHHYQGGGAAEDAGGVLRSGRCAFAAGAAQTARQQRVMITA